MTGFVCVTRQRHLLIFDPCIDHKYISCIRLHFQPRHKKKFSTTSASNCRFRCNRRALRRINLGVLLVRMKHGHRSERKAIEYQRKYAYVRGPSDGLRSALHSQEILHYRFSCLLSRYPSTPPSLYAPGLAPLFAEMNILSCTTYLNIPLGKQLQSDNTHAHQKMAQSHS